MPSVITFRKETATFIFRELHGKDDTVAMLYLNLLHQLTIYQVENNFSFARTYTSII